MLVQNQSQLKLGGFKDKKLSSSNIRASISTLKNPAISDKDKDETIKLLATLKVANIPHG